MTNSKEDLLVSIILDRSGSMESVRDDTIGAFNGLLTDLAKQAGETRLTLTQFDNQSVDLLVDGAPIADVRPLTNETFIPRGSTPLLDATGRTLAATEARVAALEWTGSVMVVIITDGHENASHEWTRSAVFARVKELESRGWAFVYLGADVNAYEEAGAMGFAAGSTSRWAKKGKNVESMGKHLASQASRYRGGVSTVYEMVSEDERREMEDE